ncbi:hypothetical protein FUAX_21400 [Fulvitalea axinellae]|uniref:Histidine phosphatase family protein n=1 Tax=Fulvitalea axinellae TaxID=1182444 RepID=A0AAU9CNT6_9BACT|nr:hypothetical protein FUAX_21400 [Fulvitalea axinellae]
MEKKLLIMRHGEAEWARPGEPDFDRRLSASGRKEASEAGLWMSQNLLIPDVVLVSGAKRTRQTAKRVVSKWYNCNPDIKYLDELYRSNHQQMLGEVNKIKNDFKIALIVAHNPTVTQFVEYLTGIPYGGMSTGSCIEIRFGLDSWAWVSKGLGEPGLFFSPSK